MRTVTLAEMGVKVRMEGDVQILGFPTHHAPIGCLAIWSNLGGTIVRGWQGGSSFSLHSTRSASHLVLKLGLAPEKPHIKAREGMIYSPLLSWKNLESLDLRVKVGPKISLPCTEKVLGRRIPPTSL